MPKDIAGIVIEIFLIKQKVWMEDGHAIEVAKQKEIAGKWGKIKFY